MTTQQLFNYLQDEANYCGGFPSFREGALEHYKEHGYMMYRTNLLEANVFANSFFKLVQELY